MSLRSEIRCIYLLFFQFAPMFTRALTYTCGTSCPTFACHSLFPERSLWHFFLCRASPPDDGWACCISGALLGCFVSAPPPRTTHEPTWQVVDEYVKVVGVEICGGNWDPVLDCALSVNEIKGLPAIPEDVCSVRERLQKLHQEKGEPLKYLLRVNVQAGSVALSKGVLSNFALGLYHWLSPAPMGILLQLSADILTALFAMMQRAQGPQRQYVSVCNVPDADREKEAGNRRMWSDHVKVKHWAEKLDTDTHIFFRESKFQDWSAYGAIQSVGRREALKGPAIPDLTQPTISVTQDDFFALGMGCPSPDIAVKYRCLGDPVSRHPLPDPPSRTPEEYEATGYRLVEDILPGDLVDQLCALHLEGEENWEDILLHGHNQGGGRRQAAPGTVEQWFPSNIKWRLLRILGNLFPVLDDLVDWEPRLVERMDAPPWRGYQWLHRDFMLTLRGAPDTRVVFVSLQDDPPEKSLQIAPGTSHGYRASNTWHVVQQKRGMGCSVLGRGAEPLVRTQFLEHPPTLNFGANHLKKWIQHPQKPPIPFLSPHNPHHGGGFWGGGSKS